MNTTIIIILIGCATLIALVAIICDYLFERKMNQQNEALVDNRNVRIHRNYIAGILAFAVIMLLTSNFGCPGNEVFAYLSFASTITSLVLSILAIFVTVKSSSDLYKNFSRLDGATHTIIKASDKVEVSVKALEGAEKSLKNASSELASHIGNMIDQIVGEIKDRIQETETHLSSRFEESINKLSGNETGSQESKQSDESFDGIKKTYLQHSSASGLLCLYASALSKEKNKPFEINALFKNNGNYIWGYLVSSIAVGLAEFDKSVKIGADITCNSIEYSSDELKMRMDELVEQHGKEYYGNGYYDSLQRIREHFGLES